MLSQWAWYLLLLGEDERSAETHIMACKQPKRTGPGDPSRRAGDLRENEFEIPKWSWVGYKSPLMDTGKEAEWILERLEERLRDELKSVAAEQRDRKKQGEHRDDEE
jgi:potassium channel subfamily K, other eukaryote